MAKRGEKPQGWFYWFKIVLFAVVFLFMMSLVLGFVKIDSPLLVFAVFFFVFPLLSVAEYLVTGKMHFSKNVVHTNRDAKWLCGIAIYMSLFMGSHLFLLSRGVPEERMNVSFTIGLFIFFMLMVLFFAFRKRKK